ncbi:MAG: transglutaminase-like domain-containing protein [Cellulomonas sp.]
MSRPSRTGRSGAIDLAVVAVLVVVAVIGFGPVWGGAGFAVAAGGALALGLALAWWGVRRGFGLLTLAAATIVTYVVAGGALALSSTTMFGVVPTLATLRGLLLGAVNSWKDLVTAATPLSAFPQLLVVPFLATLVVSVFAGSLALRARQPAWVLLPTGVLLVGVILLGSSEPAVPVTQGVAFALVALAWLSWRTAAARNAATSVSLDGVDIQQSPLLRRRRLVRAAALLVAAGMLTAAAAPVVAPDGLRRALRDVVVPPLDIHDYPSPLVAFRKYVRDEADDVLFTVDGLPAGERLRLATLDAYTGTVLDVAGGSNATGSGTFGRVGSTLPGAGASAFAGPDTGAPADLTIEVGTYQGVWVPDAGQPSALQFSGARAQALTTTLNYNPAGASALVTAGLTTGDRYTVTTTLAPARSAEDLAGTAFAAVQLPAPDRVPESVAATAAVFLGQVTDPIEQVENLREALTTGGVFSNGLDGELTSRAGHGADRIDTLLTGDDMVGDDEQFAVAMTLMARQLGIPARVVMGFYPGEDAPAAGQPYEVRGADVHAWVEVAFQGVGWVPFDAVPDKDTPPQNQDPRSQSEPQPQQLQQPPPPEEPAVAPSQPVPDAADDKQDNSRSSDWGRYVGIAAAVAIPLALLITPFVLIAMIKTRRRDRRRRGGEPADRISGGWSEVLDSALDLGLQLRGGGTRRETGVLLAELTPTVGSVALAARADAGVFGPGDPTEDEILAYWQEVDLVVGGLSGSVSRWRRARARFSLRSLRTLARARMRGWVSLGRTRGAPRARPSLGRWGAQPTGRRRSGHRSNSGTMTGWLRRRLHQRGKK